VAVEKLAETGEGDVKKFQGESGEPPLRVGDYRVRFTEEHPDISAFTQSSIAARPTADARPILSSRSVCVLDSYHCPLIPQASSSTCNARGPGCPTRISFSLFLHFRSFSAKNFH
jgi:hypothetical protein